MSEAVMTDSTRGQEGATGLHLGLLGPLNIEVDGRPVAITAARQRSVLAGLAIRPGTAISADALLEGVWGDNLPRTGSRAVAYQISKLRNLLEPDRDGDGSFITTSSAGYSLDIQPEHVDLYRFDRLVRDARSCVGDDPRHSEQLLERALAMWRGRPFADVGPRPFVEAETRRLEQQRLLARRTVAEARIAQGRYVDTIADLEVLVAEQPLEEALVRMLMIALHGAGRTAEALRAFGELRRRLGDELGIEPSSDLQQLETSLLTGEGVASQSPGDDGDRTDDKPDGHDEEAGRPPLAASAVARSAPASLSSFVGRAAELSEITALIESARLVTLSGFGGLGKTRLAQEIVAAQARRQPDGVWFVDLTPIADSALLADTLIAAGGGGVSADQLPIDLLLTLLAPLELLLVIDNCEHLVDDVAELVAKIVATAPGVRVLATSRRSLGVVGEAVWPVPPLDEESAQQLFIERARLVRPGFTVGESNRPSVEQLCSRLEGIPLAIEMAAGRLSVLTVEQIADHLDDRFQLLTRGERRADHNQRSLAAVLDWSHDLLEPDDRRLLARLSIFSDGFDLDAATALRPPELEPAEMLDRLAHLVEVSLVSFSDRDGVPRYHLLETVREHAAARLEPDEAHQLALSHAEYFERMASGLFDLSTHETQTVLAVGDRELGNIRSAMACCFANGRPLLGLAIISHVRNYMWSKMMNREILRWLLGGIDLVDDDGPEVLRAAAVAVVEAFNVGDHAAGNAAVERIAAGIDAVEDDDELRAMLLVALGTNLIDTAPSSADDYYLQAAALPSLEPVRVLSILNNRVEISWISGSLVDGDAIVERLHETAGALPVATPMAVKIESGVAARSGRWDEVIRLAESATDLDPANKAAVQITYAEALGAVGRHDEAQDVLDRLDLVAHGHYVRNADLVHAAISLDRGDGAAAAARLTDLVEMIDHDERRVAIAVPVAALLASAACDLDQVEEAATLIGFVEAEQDRLDIGLRPTDRRLFDAAVERCRSSLGARRFGELNELGAGVAWEGLPTIAVPG